MGPIERNPSVILNNKGPPAQPPSSFSSLSTSSFSTSAVRVSASPAIIYSCWRPSLVTMAKLSIHSGYLPGKRPPPRAGTRLLHRLSRFRVVSRGRDAPREREKGRERQRKRTKEEAGEERKLEGGMRSRRHTRAHTYSCAELFSPSFVTLRAARDCYRPFP